MDDRWRDRIRWRSRRGLLENDLLLTRFLAQHLDAMQPEEVQVLDRLLRMEDNDLLDLLMGRTRTEDLELAALVTRIGGAGPAEIRQE